MKIRDRALRGVPARATLVLALCGGLSLAGTAFATADTVSPLVEPHADTHIDQTVISQPDYQVNPRIVAIPTAAITGFNPGMIISDKIFYNSSTMDAADIQNFLNKQGSSCKPGTDTEDGKTVSVPCLKDYSQKTSGRDADKYCTGAYAGASKESAATIIAKVGKACGINPQVILTILQKEQGLVTASGSGLQLSDYQKAMGYGCPDTAACDTKYYGFFNQVYSAAHRFQYYRLHPTEFNHLAGKVNDLRYHPNRDCGTVAVYIENQATAGLYNYTPYTPNAAALAAGTGEGDKCSSYGNRNFFRNFTTWFGSTGAVPPFPTERVAGRSRIETATAISARAFPQGSQRVYIARSDRPVDALVGGILPDGPVLLVPVGGDIPAAVSKEIRRLKATEVVVLGGTAALPPKVLSAAAAGRATSRIAGPNRYETAAAIARYAFPNGASRVYLANGYGTDGNGSPDAVVGGSLTDGPMLLVSPQKGASWNIAASLVKKWNPTTVVALGGVSAVSDEALRSVALKRDTARLAGSNRYETAAAIARHAFPPGKSTPQAVYVTRGDVFADALVSGALTDGPVVLMPSRTKTTPPAVHSYLKELQPPKVVALGGTISTSLETINAVTKSIKAGR